MEFCFVFQQDDLLVYDTGTQYPKPISWECIGKLAFYSCLFATTKQHLVTVTK